MKELYFDHSASTPPYEEVIQTMAEVMRLHYANPSSIHAGGSEAAKLIERSRNLVAKQLGTSRGRWIFTSGGTESNNLAIKGAAKQYRSRGNHIITTAIEHASVMEVMKQLETEGFRVTYLPVLPTGHVAVDAVRDALTEDTILVSIMHVNNEIGTIQPIEEIGRLLSGYPHILFHTDAVQSLGKVKLDPDGWGIDLVSGSAHKLRGPRGAGYLYVGERALLTPLAQGGEQEAGLRPGTENVPAIVASAKAVRMSIEAMEERQRRHCELKKQLNEFIAASDKLSLNGAEPAAPHIIHFSYPGMKPEVMIHMLEERGILASTKSACSSKEDKPSKVLLAIGKDAAHASSGIRISLGDEHTSEDIVRLTEALDELAKELATLERRRGR
ncbi:cysteine desulfurase family protein [Paenibacillus sp. HB172176]|uniref:cysteine desulfurase family protein n=1 Tax=Paenibacillus sp. HB172176 TaxID=2493690 RepID=UPI00143CB855|nr:cysteine desulfurase family protein [Paenibacillus sp. HB172176]